MREFYSHKIWQARKWKLDSCNCGNDCNWSDEDDQCEGPISVIDEIQDGDEDWSWVHACEKHENLWN